MLIMEKSESSLGRRSTLSKGAGTMISENLLKSTGLAAQPSSTVLNGTVESVARQNIASAVEHGSGRRSLSESLLIDPNSSAGNVSLRKQFHDKEDPTNNVPNFSKVFYKCLHLLLCFLFLSFMKDFCC